MWKELIQGLTDDYTFYPPASSDDIDAVEQTLDVKLPYELKGLLSETNGVHGEYELGLIWSTEQIQRENLQLRQPSSFEELYMPFDLLLFFADAGNGDLFAFIFLNGKVRRPDIFVWNHENDSRTWVAPSLQRYLEWWLSGKLTV